MRCSNRFGDEHGQSVVEYVILPDKEEAIHFLSKTGGWMALYQKIAHIRDGKSTVYKSSMTWEEIAHFYAGNSAAWVANVTKQLGVNPTDKFGAYFGQPVSAMDLEDEA